MPNLSIQFGNNEREVRSTKRFNTISAIDVLCEWPECDVVHAVHVHALPATAAMPQLDDS